MQAKFSCFLIYFVYLRAKCRLVRHNHHTIMKRISLFVAIFLLATVAAVAQTIKIQCHVKDSFTDEALPYVSIYVSPEKATITNHDGDFTLEVGPEEMVRFSYVGYNTLTIKASEVPEEVSMVASERTLHQITVMPIDDILKRVVDQLKKEFKKKGTKTSQYFCRLTSHVADKDELTEAFLDASSAINLRGLNLLTGRRGQMTRWGLIRPTLSDINFQHVLEAGPMVLENSFWNNRYQPLSPYADITYFRKYYSLHCETLQDSLQGKIYCITMLPREDADYRGYIQGKIYVKAGTYQLLRFDGEVTDMSLEIKKRSQVVNTPVKIKLDINYNLADGFTQVEDISCVIDGGKELHTQTILHNVSKTGISFKKSKKKAVKENMLSAIDEAGYDSTVWKYAGVVQRTRYEEQLAQEQAVIDSAALTQDLGDDKLDKLIDRVRLFGQRIPQEKVFLHLDNTSYFLGDTIWYAAYTRQTNNDLPSSISNVLYVEMLNNDGYVEERQVVKLKDGRGHGNFYLDPERYAGFYEIRAYTRWQLNWGYSEREHGTAAKRWFIDEDKEHEFFRDYDKIYSRVVPVYDKPTEPNAFYHDMTLRPLRRYFRKDPDKREMLLNFFPEGGNLVEGVPCQVAFEAAWDDGEWVDGTLMVDSVEAATVHRGRGVITITPEHKKTPKVQFTTSKGEKVKGKWPKAEASGVALHAEQHGGIWTIKAQATSDLCPDSLAMTVMHEGVLTHVSAFHALTDSITLHNSLLKPGVHQVTVFGSAGQVYADRLFFVGADSLTQAQSTLTITGKRDLYLPYEAITLQVQANAETAPSQPISFAVRDAWNQDHLYDTGNMLTEMLLASEIKGFIPHPEWYFERDDEEHRQGLDLLMLTQGWRRYTWREMAVPGEWELIHPDEKNLVIEGAVKPYVGAKYMEELERGGLDLSGLTAQEAKDLVSTKTKKELTVHAELVEGQTLNAIDSEMMTTGHRFRMKLPDFYDRSIFFISAADLTKLKPGKQYTWIQQHMPAEWLPTGNTLKFEMMAEDPEYMVYLSQPWPRYAIPFSWYQNHLAPAPVKKEGETMGRRKFSDGSVELNEVSVKAKRNGMRKFSDSEPAFTVDAYDAYNACMDAGFHSVDPEFIVRAYVGDLGLDDPYRLDENGNRTSNISIRYGLNPERRAHEQGIDSDSIKVLESLGGQYPIDTLYNRRHLWSMEYDISPGERRYYFEVDEYNLPTDRLDFHKLEKFVLYTDYAPRQIGERRYMGSDLPEQKLALYPYADGGRRNFYRDRRYIIQGFNIADDFYHPNYTNRPLPKDGASDCRRTLYWNPDLKLDEQGHATVKLFNSSREAEISISAEGMTSEGEILTGKE